MQHFRQPKIYIALPSKGVYLNQGSVQGDVNNIPVCGMSGMDEIIMRTPDSLLSGESTVSIVKSCCPNIKDPWDLAMIDTDLIFTAIRIATYGNEMTVGHKCSNCDHEADYALDLTRIIDHFNNCKYDDTIVLKDLKIKIRPLTYKQSTEVNLRNFGLQKKLLQTKDITDEAEQQRLIADLWKDLADIQTDMYISSVEAVETANQRVEERVFIVEWLKNCDKSIFDAIQKHIDHNRDIWQMPSFPVECPECKTQTNLFVDLDQSNFFA